MCESVEFPVTARLKKDFQALSCMSTENAYRLNKLYYVVTFKRIAYSAEFRVRYEFHCFIIQQQCLKVSIVK